MAIPQPKPRDWQVANAKVLQATDKQVLAMLRDAKKRVDTELNALVAAENASAAIRRGQLEQSRARLLAEQARVFERLGDIVKARRLDAASRAGGLSAASSARLLQKVGEGEAAKTLYDSFLQTSQNAIDAALARMRLSALPLAERIYRTGVWMNGRLGKLINAELASGLDARRFAKAARDWFNPNTPGGVRFAAMRLARTEINNSFHAMSVEKARQTPWIPHMEWNLSRAHPKPDECNPLADHDEGLGAGVYKAEEVPARPHPQCMCYVTPKPIDEDEFVDNFLDGEYDDFLDGELEKQGVPRDAAAKPKPASRRKTGRKLQSANPQRAEQPQSASPASFDSRIQVAAKDEAALAASAWGLDRADRPAAFLLPWRQGLNRYTGTWYRPINGKLRGKEVREEDQEVVNEVLPQLREAFAAVPGSSRDVIAYRAMHSARVIFGDRMDNDLTGLEWQEQAYSSLSALERRASFFTGGVGASDRVMMRVLVPAGSKTIEASGVQLEAEILLDKDAHFRIVRDNGVDENGIRRIDVEVIPAPVTEAKPEPEQQVQIKPEVKTDGYSAGQWTLANDDEDDIRQMMESISVLMPKEKQEELEKAEGPSWLRSRAEKFIQGSKTENEVRYQNGPHRVRFTGQYATDEQKRRQFLEDVDFMQSQYPTGHEMFISVAASTEFDHGVGGETLISSGSMSINEKYLGNEKLWSGMPISRTVTAAQYILAHEWGHSLSTKDEADEAHTHDHALEAGGMTRYGTADYNGKKAPREGYAEAFAEWALSRGQTTNPATLVYAKRFKWGERFGIG